MKKAVIAIPARYQSTRFPGKPLAKLCGKPMIQWVYERAAAARGVYLTLVATDDDRINDVVKQFGGNAVMTGPCNCGTDRIYEATKDIPCDIVVNVQGDEPTIQSEEIEKLIDVFNDETVCMATLKKRLPNRAAAENQNVVKVVTDINDDALYFSRSVIPFDRDENSGVVYYGHIGVYAFRKDFLKAFVELSPARLEQIEKLEQLRALENGFRIRVIETEYSHIGVDSPADLTFAESLLRGDRLK